MMPESIALQNISWQEAFEKISCQNNTLSSTININKEALIVFSRRQFSRRVLKNICFAT